MNCSLAAFLVGRMGTTLDSVTRENIMTVYTVTPLDDPSANGGTSASGINNTGQIVGSYSVIGVSPITHQGYGFLYNRQDGTYTTLDDPLTFHGGIAPGTSAEGINDVGQVVGVYNDNTGFLYIGGTYIPLNVPGATKTYAYGINNAGQIAGYYTTGSGTGSVSHGFIYDGSTYTTLDDPLAGPGGTFAYGINNAGQIVGSYNDASGIGSHGFLYSRQQRHLHHPRRSRGHRHRCDRHQ